MYKCELYVGGYAYNAADLLKNWDEVVGSIKRNDYDGVMRTFSNKFEFVLDARLLLMREYKEKYLNASANIVISIRNNSWTYNEELRCALDFSTISDDGNVVSINAIDDSVASLIKAKKGTQYEYIVITTCEKEKLYYDRIIVNNTIPFSPYQMDSEAEDQSIYYYSDKDITGTRQFFYMPLLYVSPEISKKGSEFVEYNDSTQLIYGNIDPSTGKLKSSVPAIIRALKDVEINISYNFKVNVMQGSDTGIVMIDAMVYEDEISQDGVTAKFVSNVTLGYTYGLGISTISGSKKIQLKENQYIAIAFNKDKIYILSISVFNFDSLEFSYKSKGDPVSIDVITPTKLLNRLLNSMNGGRDGLIGVIEPSGEQRLDNALIVPAESARKLPKAKVYCSFTKFSNWMSSVFGYAYEINGNTVTFKHRNKFFNGNVVKKIENYTNYEFKVNSALVYSGLRIGYDKQDYESTNGKDEFRFTNEYTSGINLTDNKKELISPLRADAYGIEFLVEKIGLNTTDNESDNDIFFVCATLLEERYLLKRNVEILGVISSDTMFNAMYSPSSMIEANKNFLGVSLSNLTFASSDGNSDVIIDGLAENRNISINERLFTVGEYSVETSDVYLPDNIEGIIEFEHKGVIKQGYYLKADYNYGRLESSKIELIAKQ